MGMLSGKEKEKQARLSQITFQKASIDRVLQSINNIGLTPNNRYSVHDILADIQILIKDESVSKEHHEEALTYRNAIMSVYSKGVNQNKVKLIIDEKEKTMSGNDRAEKFMQSIAPTLPKGFVENRPDTKTEVAMRSVFTAISNGKKVSNDIDR
jgi:hypothetical protein